MITQELYASIVRPKQENLNRGWGKYFFFLEEMTRRYNRWNCVNCFIWCCSSCWRIPLESSNLMWSFYVKIQVCWIVKHYKWTYFAFRSIFFHHSFGLLHQCLDLLVFGNDFFVTLERPKKLESSDEVFVSPMCEIQTFSCRNQINREQKPSSIWDNLNRPLVRMKSKKLSSMITWGKQDIYKSLQ